MLKILMLTPQLPYPPRQGASLRNYHNICGLAQRHEITLLSFLEDNQTTDSTVIGPLLDLCATIETIPVPARSQQKRLIQVISTRGPDMAHRLHSPIFNETLHTLLSRDRYDIVQIEGLELAAAIEIVRTVSPKSKVVFDDHNAESELQWRAFLTDLRDLSRWPAAAYSGLQIGRLRRFERWACENADWITVVSEADRDHLRSLLFDAHHEISVIPNSIDAWQLQEGVFSKKGILPDADEEMDETPAYDLLFSGKMDYRPNVDAVLWFADAIWPLIRAERPNATWAIVGQKPHSRLERLQKLDGITLTGWVESVQPYLTGASVYIMPFRMGSGTRLKLIEALAAGKAMVSTSIGAEGFPVEHGRELLLAESKKSFASAVLHLLDHPDERQRLGQAGREFAQQYDWRQIVPRFDDVFQQLLS